MQAKLITIIHLATPCSRAAGSNHHVVVRVEGRERILSIGSTCRLNDEAAALATLGGVCCANAAKLLRKQAQEHESMYHGIPDSTWGAVSPGVEKCGDAFAALLDGLMQQSASRRQKRAQDKDTADLLARPRAKHPELLTNYVRSAMVANGAATEQAERFKVEASVYSSEAVVCHTLLLLNRKGEGMPLATRRRGERWRANLDVLLDESSLRYTCRERGHCSFCGVDARRGHRESRRHKEAAMRAAQKAVNALQFLQLMSEGKRRSR